VQFFFEGSIAQNAKNDKKKKPEHQNKKQNHHPVTHNNHAVPFDLFAKTCHVLNKSIIHEQQYHHNPLPKRFGMDHFFLPSQKKSYPKSSIQLKILILFSIQQPLSATITLKRNFHLLLIFHNMGV